MPVAGRLPQTASVKLQTAIQREGHTGQGPSNATQRNPSTRLPRPPSCAAKLRSKKETMKQEELTLLCLVQGGMAAWSAGSLLRQPNTAIHM
jgi:hypothetical protein